MWMILQLCWLLPFRILLSPCFVCSTPRSVVPSLGESLQSLTELSKTCRTLRVLIVANRFRLSKFFLRMCYYGQKSSLAKNGVRVHISNAYSSAHRFSLHSVEKLPSKWKCSKSVPRENRESMCLVKHRRSLVSTLKTRDCDLYVHQSRPLSDGLEFIFDLFSHSADFEELHVFSVDAETLRSLGDAFCETRMVLRKFKLIREETHPTLTQCDLLRFIRRARPQKLISLYRPPSLTREFFEEETVIQLKELIIHGERGKKCALTDNTICDGPNLRRLCVFFLPTALTVDGILQYLLRIESGAKVYLSCIMEPADWTRLEGQLLSRTTWRLLMTRRNGGYIFRCIGGLVTSVAYERDRTALDIGRRA